MLGQIKNMFDPKNLKATSRVSNLDIPKIIYALIIIITIFCLLKINANGELKKVMLDSKAETILASLQKIHKEQFDEVLTKSPFCGWKMEQGDGEVISSKDFETTSVNGRNFTRDIESDNIVSQKLTICLAAFDAIDASTNRQFVFIIFLSAIMAVLVFNLSVSKADENQEKVQNTQEG